ncbi:hypothetical protein NEFER01_0544 [Nematocida sp. LUAm1]|nr:hypothetical protein NEFER02_0453 [Nematocida sp. LUAm2]KAI5177269.1 hypothetical protein NEFER01_0544 [Nematocida sp. LUAm1]
MSKERREDLLSFNEMMQQIAELEISSSEDAQRQLDLLRKTLEKRHHSYDMLQKDIQETAEEVEKAVNTYETVSGGDKERILKKVIYKKLEILVSHLVEHEENRKDIPGKKKQELLASYLEQSKSLISTAGKVLNMAKTSLPHVPLVLLIVKQLMRLADAFSLFIPTSYYLLNIMNQMGKIAPCSTPLLPIADGCVKVQEKYINSTIYKEYAMNNSLDLLVCDLKRYSTSLGFPEYSANIAAEIKRVRNSPNKCSTWINGKIERVARCVKEHSEKIVKIREALSVFDEEKVRKMEQKIPELQISIE